MVLCGGRGTRLGAITETIPKCLVEIAGKPFLAHQLELLKREGSTKVYLLTGYLSDLVEDYVKGGNEYGLSIECIADGKKTKGTGGAVKSVVQKLNGTVAVMYGDSYLDIPMASVYQRFQKCGQQAMMTVIENHGAVSTQKSNVEYDPVKTLVKNYSKNEPTDAMKYIDYGLSFFNAEYWKNLEEKTPFDLGQVFTNLSKEGKLAGYQVQRRFYEINTPEGLIETRAYLSRNSLW